MYLSVGKYIELELYVNMLISWYMHLYGMYVCMYMPL